MSKFFRFVTCVRVFNTNTESDIQSISYVKNDDARIYVPRDKGNVACTSQESFFSYLTRLFNLYNNDHYLILLTYDWYRDSKEICDEKMNKVFLRHGFYLEDQGTCFYVKQMSVGDSVLENI